MSLSPASQVLVCLLPTPRDLEIARLFGWYRIPLRTAPKVVAVDYRAFYQPAAFGEHGGRSSAKSGSGSRSCIRPANT